MMLLRSLAAISQFTFLLHGTSFAAAVSSGGDEWERTVKAAEQEGQVSVYKLATDAEFHAFPTTQVPILCAKTFPKTNFRRGRSGKKT
jgi:hypothetical protein